MRLRALSLSVCLAPLVAFMVLGAPPARAQAPLPPLAFLGFEAGATLVQVREQVRALGGRGLRCDRARRDPAVHECRATVFDPASGRPLGLWLSAMDSASGVLTLSAPASGVELEQWKTDLETRYGLVGARVQGPQWMLQWVRQGRMLRLTWRIEKGDKTVSVSLVDGGVLDGWGRRRAEQQPVATPDSTPTPVAADSSAGGKE